jgi:hypothetical protein
MTSKLPNQNNALQGTGFQDKDKRRAALLSLLLHALFILLIALYRTPQPEPLETYLVIDVGVPAFDEEETLASAADAPAPQASEPLVEAEAAGTPQAQAPEEAPPAPAPAPQPAQEETQLAETSTPPAPQPEPIEETPEPVAETPAPAPEPTPAPEPVAEVPAPQPEPEVAPEPTPEPVTQAAPPAEVELPETEQPAATLPEIDAPEAPPEAQAIALPTPTPEVEVAPAVSVATEATAEVTPEQTVPTPNVQANVAESQDIPLPSVETNVTEAAPVPQPQVQTSVAEAQTIPTPQVAATVTEAQAVPLPNASASVTEAQAIPSPSAQANVTASQDIPQPQTQATVTPSATPSVESEVTQTSDADSSVQATTDSSTSAAGEDGTGASAVPNAVTATAEALGQRSPEDGGNASTSGQTTADPDASADNLGLAASPDGVGEGTGAPFAKVPYRENRDRPLNVMIDNTFGYPQAGLREASMIVEMPVEGGSTRLMTVYDRVDPSRVGPVRSARDYFHALSSGMDGILVHDGGSPQAMAAIESASVPTLNAYSNGTLFERGGGEAPYNLFSSGTSLRQAIAKLQLNKSRAVSGTIFRPTDEETSVTNVSVNYSGIYESGFEYIADLDQYRWIRNGDNAVDFAGEAVYANAVVVASITAREISDDPAGRLYIPLASSRATLYVRGKAIEGNWSPEGGVRFTSSLGEVIDLTPFKTWVLFAPTYADVTQQ